MKNNGLCLGLLSVILLFVQACTLHEFNPEEWAVEPELELSENYVIFTSVVGSQKISVTTNYDSFTAKTDAEWCHITTDIDSMCFWVEVDPNESVEQRVAIVQISVSRGNKSLIRNFSVVQVGGIWDTIGDFNVFWQHEVGVGQRDALVELIEGLKFVEGGTFLMGDSVNAHWVTLSSFYIGKFEVTQKQWNALMFRNSALFRGENLPIENISWADALEFVNRLSELTNLDFALPTEAQWEYAARGGKYSLGYKYPGSNDYTEVAHFVDVFTSEDSPLYTTVAGGSKLPNELGLYDMAGNVAEFCFDWYDADFSAVPTDQDPIGVDTGIYKVVRGGRFSFPYLQYEVSRRNFCGVSYINENTGIRVVLKP